VRESRDPDAHPEGGRQQDAERGDPECIHETRCHRAPVGIARRIRQGTWGDLESGDAVQVTEAGRDAAHLEVGRRLCRDRRDDRRHGSDRHDLPGDGAKARVVPGKREPSRGPRRRVIFTPDDADR
jgi:hypothetical protein